MPEDFIVVLNYLIHLCEISGFVGVGVFLFEEMVKKVVLSWLDNHICTLRVSTAEFTKGLDQQINSFRNEFLKVVKDKELVFEVGKEEYFSAQEKAIDQDLIARAQNGYHKNQDVTQALEDAMSGDSEKAIATLRGLVEQDPKFKKQLLVALIISFDQARWREAEELLEEVGEPSHYSRLAFGYWKQNDTAHAVKLAEKGYEKALAAPKCDMETIGRLRNSLAYYYADLYLKSGGAADKADIALKMATDEANRRSKNAPNSKGYAEALDTEGFVRIAYGKTRDEIIDGDRKCASAYALGSTRELYLLHHKIADRKLEETSPQS